MKKILIFLIVALSVVAFGQNTSTSFVEFDGTDDYVRYTDDATLGIMDGATDYTIEAWVYIPSIGANAGGRIVQRYSLFMLYYGTSNSKLSFGVDNGTSWVYYHSNDNTLPADDSWHHVAAIRNTTDGTFKLYVDGIDVSSGVWSGYALENEASRNLYIGQDGGGSNFFEGAIDEVRLKNIAVSLASLNSDRNADEYVSDVNTAALFHFDENSGTNTVNEASGTNATLNNGTTWRVWDYFGASGDYTDNQNLPLGADPSPVELISFTSSKTDTGVLLNWETATEVNNHGFEIESSMDGDNWSIIGFVDGHGNSNTPQSYSFIATDDANYYRLKQIDTDGDFEYSDIIKISIANMNKVIFEQNYPNPFNPSTMFNFSIPNNEFVTLAIYNSLGEKVAEVVNQNMNAGTHSYIWNATEMTSGVYFAKLNVGAKTQIQKIMLLK